MAIAFVAAGTPYINDAGAGGTSFTLNKPSGVASGDVMVAMIAFWTTAERTITPPSGWTSRQSAYRGSSGDAFQMAMFTRTAGSSEPSSWTASISGAGYLRVAEVVAYSGVQTIGSSSKGTAGSASSVSTGSVTASVTGTRRVVCGAYFDANTNSTISSNETTRRTLGGTDTGAGDVQGAIWDSDDTAVSGSTSRTVSRSAAWDLAAAAILLLEPSAGTPATGGFTVACSKVTFEDGVGDVHDDGDMDVQLGSATMDFGGLGQPIPAEGDVDVQLPSVALDFGGNTDVRGSMSLTFLPTVSFVGETRFFGVRVIEVEFDDSRIIEVQSRAVDD